MKIIDKYIIRNFVGTFFFMVLILSSIAVVVDLSQRLGRIYDNGSTILHALTLYYPYWSVWIVNTFLPIAVFITVIYFTSRLTMQTEVVGINAGGISFYRFSLPYVLVAIVIAISSFFVNNIILPWANIKKNNYKYEYIHTEWEKQEYYKNQSIGAQISKNEYLFIDSYDRINKSGNLFAYQKIDSLILNEQILANSFEWNSDSSTYLLKNVYIRKLTSNKKDEESVFHEAEKIIKLPVTPDEILPEEYVAETMNSFELSNFIEKQKQKGSANVNGYENELNMRFSNSFSTIILTILALSLSSKKRRGGIGINLAVGIVLAFVYVFFTQTTSALSQKGSVSPFISAWLPNIIFGTLTLILYIRRARS